MSEGTHTPTHHAARLVFLDRLRIVGMLDIISNHVGLQYVLGGVGLPIFLITSVAVNVRKPVPPTVGEVARRRARTVLVPWLFWTVAYIPLAGWEISRQGYSPFEALTPTMLFYGPAIHLWFLPFIVPANIAAVFLARRTLGLSIVRVIWGAAWIGGLLLVATAWLRMRLHAGPPFGQWLFSIPSLPLGMAVGRSISAGSRRSRALLAMACVAVLAIAFALLGPRTVDLEYWLITRYGWALLLISIACLWTGRGDDITSLLARNTLGIYLVHPALIMISNRFGLNLGWLWGQTILIYCCSLGLVLMLRKTALRRFV